MVRGKERGFKRGRERGREQGREREWEGEYTMFRGSVDERKEGEGEGRKDEEGKRCQKRKNEKLRE